MHICQDEINAALMAIPFVGVGFAVARTWWRHAIFWITERRK